MRQILAALCLAAFCNAAAAQTPAGDREKLVAVYRLTISQEMCKFELSDDQADAVGKASDKLEQQLALSDEDSQKLYDQVQASMEQQKTAGLCDAKGEWSMVYKQAVADLMK